MAASAGCGCSGARHERADGIGMRLDELNALTHKAAVRAFERCCGSTRWAEQMASRRPFSTIDSLDDTADDLWRSLDPADWLQAFGAHPRIGDRSDETNAPAGETTAWSAQEQLGVTADARQQFVVLNRRYEQRFGHIFIVCASGKSGSAMLDILERRMLNTPEVELREAAEQQRQITRLRLRKLLSSEANDYHPRP
jgi:OHCU decarboxylase